MSATEAMPWPADLPPLDALLEAARLELMSCHEPCAEAVLEGTVSVPVLELFVGCRRALVLLAAAELRRHHAWPPLSPPPRAVLEWLEHRVRDAQRAGAAGDLPYLNVLRWLLSADLLARQPAPNEFEQDLSPPRVVVR